MMDAQIYRTITVKAWKHLWGEEDSPCRLHSNCVTVQIMTGETTVLESTLRSRHWCASADFDLKNSESSFYLFSDLSVSSLVFSFLPKFSVFWWLRHAGQHCLPSTWCPRNSPNVSDTQNMKTPVGLTSSLWTVHPSYSSLFLVWHHTQLPFKNTLQTTSYKAKKGQNPLHNSGVSFSGTSLGSANATRHKQTQHGMNIPSRDYQALPSPPSPLKPSFLSLLPLLSKNYNTPFASLFSSDFFSTCLSHSRKASHRRGLPCPTRKCRSSPRPSLSRQRSEDRLLLAKHSCVSPPKSRSDANLTSHQLHICTISVLVFTIFFLGQSPAASMYRLLPFPEMECAVMDPISNTQFDSIVGGVIKNESRDCRSINSAQIQQKNVFRQKISATRELSVRG